MIILQDFTCYSTCMASVLVTMGEILKNNFDILFILMVHCEKCTQICITVEICADIKFSLVALYSEQNSV